MHVHFDGHIDGKSDEGKTIDAAEPTLNSDESAEQPYPPGQIQRSHTELFSQLADQFVTN
jgi:hypothetical protein